VVITDGAGRVCDVNEETAKVLGCSHEMLAGIDLWTLVDRKTQAWLIEFFANFPQGPKSVTKHMGFRRSDGAFTSVIAAIAPFADPKGAARVRIRALEDTERAGYIAELESRVELLTSFIEASAEATWCMEYTEPVNLRTSTQEIVRQVFENECHWRMCNGAMARLYDLPDGLDFNRQPVSTYFRRNPENEAFVRLLIESRFHIDSVPTLEHRHDGQLMYVEDSVRSHIEGDFLFRMWGTIRDITELRTTQNMLAERQREVTEILSALPDAILVVDIHRRAVAVNPAFEATFGWRAEEMLGKDVSPIVDLDAKRPGAGRWFSQAQSRWLANVTSAGGQKCRCDIRISPIPVVAERRFVLSLRPVLEALRTTPYRKEAKSAARGSSLRRAR
jgi:PAS domain S-box-containing protein